MKQLFFFLSIILFAGFSGRAQTDLVGNWYLDNLVIDGNIYQNVYGSLNMNFTTSPSAVGFLYDGTSSCNAIFSSYSNTVDQITIYGIGMTLQDCSFEPRGQFEDMYIRLISDNFALENTFDYSIEGSGNSQILTMTNTEGDQIIYSKVENLAILNRTWYLESVVDEGLTYTVSSPDAPTLLLSNNVDFVMGGSIALDGLGDCNSFTGSYYIYFNNGDEIDVSSFTPTTATCDPPSDFEDAYFSILGDEATNKFQFEIINDGNQLILTSISDGSGGRLSGSSVSQLIFSKQALSTEEFEHLSQLISLKQNPVTDQLEFIFNNLISSQSVDYTIYSVNGKRIASGQLSDDSITLNDFSSGLYIIQFSSDSGETSTLKFMKK